MHTDANETLKATGRTRVHRRANAGLWPPYRAFVTVNVDSPRLGNWWRWLLLPSPINKDLPIDLERNTTVRQPWRESRKKWHSRRISANLGISSSRVYLSWSPRSCFINTGLRSVCSSLKTGCIWVTAPFLSPLVSRLDQEISPCGRKEICRVFWNLLPTQPQVRHRR